MWGDGFFYAITVILDSAVDSAVARILKAETEEAGPGSEEPKADCDCGGTKDDCDCVEKAVAPVEEELGNADDKGDVDSEQKGQGLGDMLRQLRDEKEMTNDDLAEAAGLTVGSIGGILAGTTGCPKVGQLQGLARRMGVSLSSLVAAAEADGCADYGGAESSAADQGQDKAGDEQGNVPIEIKSGDEVREMSDADIAKQVDALVSGFPGLELEIDPGLQAWVQYEQSILIEKEA